MSTKTAKKAEKQYCNIYFNKGRFKVEPTDETTWLGRYPHSPEGRLTTVKSDRVEAGKIALTKVLFKEKAGDLKDIQKEVDALQKVLDKAVVDKYETDLAMANTYAVNYHQM